MMGVVIVSGGKLKFVMNDAKNSLIKFVIVFCCMIVPCGHAAYIRMNTTSHGFLSGDQVSLLVESEIRAMKRR